MKHTNPWLDIVRSAAIIFVLLSHSRGFIVPTFPSLEILKLGGFFGVEIFFVLSGFLIGKILSSLASNFSPHGIKNFLVRRWLRTLPNYYLFLFLAALFSIEGIRSDALPNLIEYIFFLQNLYYPHPAFFGEAWSLSVEEFFYFSFPVAVFFVVYMLGLSPKKTMVILGILILFACSLARLFVADIPGIQWGEGIRKLVLLRLDAIMLGVLAAFLLEGKSWFIETKLCVLILMGCFFFALIYAVDMRNENLSESYFAKTVFFNITSLGCLGFILFGYHFNVHVTIRKVARFIAKTSYSAYLCHLFIIAILTKYVPIPLIIKWVLFFPLVFICSYGIYVCWESKFLAYRDNKFK